MISKSLVVVLVASAAVTGAAMVGSRVLRDPVPMASRAPVSEASVTQSPRAPGSASIQGPNVVPTRHPQANEQPGVTGAGNSNISSNGRLNLLRQDRVKNGVYSTVIAGFYSGAGVIDVKDDRITIKANVKSADGRTGELIVPSMTVLGPYFFGTGAMLGQQVQISGRVDAARASRLVANFTVADGHGGRMFGSLPLTIDAGDDDWIGDAMPVRSGQ